MHLRGLPAGFRRAPWPPAFLPGLYVMAGRSELSSCGREVLTAVNQPRSAAGPELVRKGEKLRWRGERMATHCLRTGGAPGTSRGERLDCPVVKVRIMALSSLSALLGYRRRGVTSQGLDCDRGFRRRGLAPHVAPRLQVGSEGKLTNGPSA